MEILYLLIPLSMVFVALAIAILFWAVRSGQHEDMEGPAYRILFDEDDPTGTTRLASGERVEEIQEDPEGDTKDTKSPAMRRQR